MRTPQRCSHILLALVVFLTSGCEFIQTTSTDEVSVGTPTTLPADFTVVPENTPPPPPEEVPPPPTQDDIEIMEEGIVLRDIESRTKVNSVTADFITLNRYLMKLGYADDCSDGQWEPWVATRNINLAKKNQVVTISVQYQDWDYRVSPCYKQSFIHDAQGPDILFQAYPQGSVEEGSSGTIRVMVSDPLSPVTSVTCSLNGLVRPCVAGLSEINISAMPVGDYEFHVQAVDEMGNESQQSVNWTVVSTTRLLSQTIRVDNYKKVDVLFVIDNSGSMEYEQRSMAQRTSNFLSILRGLDWQIGITTTDPRSTVSWGDGKLLPLTGASSEYIIKSSWNESTAQQRLSQTLQRSETGAGNEQGIRAVYRAVERYAANESLHRSLIRDGAQLAVVLISDEDESDNTNKNDPTKLVNYIHTTFGGQKRFSFHSIITRPGDTACRSTYGAVYGERYKIMSEMTGGLIGNVCEMDYTAQVQGIAQGVRDLLKTLTLECAPLVDKGITIEKDGTVINPNFVVEGVNLKFDTELDPGDFKVTYRCLK